MLLKIVQVEQDMKNNLVQRISSNFSQAGFKIKFRRNTLRYLTNYYLPSAIFVTVSWVHDERKKYFF